MRTGLIVAALAVAVAGSGVYLYRSVGDGDSTRGSPREDAAATPTRATPATRSLADDHPRVTMPPRREPAAPSAPTAERPTIDPPTSAPSAPGPRLDARPPTTATAAPASTEQIARITGELDGPTPPTLPPDAAQALADARMQFRAGDDVGARGLAHSVLATAPDTSAARRLAVSASCRLGDTAQAQADAAALSRNERGALTRYCREHQVELGPPPP